MATAAEIPEDESASQKIILEQGYSMTENRSSMDLSTSKPPAEYICKSEHCHSDKIENLTITKLSEDERQHQTVSNNLEAREDKVEEAINVRVIEESTHQTEKDGAKGSIAEEPMTDQYESSEVIAESTQKGMITSQENENTRSKGEEDADLECTEQPASTTSETNTGLINEAPLPILDLTTKNQGEEDGSVEDEVKELSLDDVQMKKEDISSLPGGECKDPESIESRNKLEHDNNTEYASTINFEESGYDAALKIGDNVDDKIENPFSDQVTDGVSTQVATQTREILQEAASTVCRDKIEDISVDSRINLEKHHEEKRDSQPENGQEDQLREQATLIAEETEIKASRENAEKRVEQNILPVEEFEEREKDEEPTSTPDSGETSISTEKIPPLTESITEIKGEEGNMNPQEIAHDLNSTDPLVGETEQPDRTAEVPKTEAREEHKQSKKFFSENNEQDEHLSETQSTENLIVKHMDSEAIVTTETITQLAKDTEDPQNVLDSHSEVKMGIKSDGKIISEETTEGEEAINKQLSATESATEDEDPSRPPTVVTSARDEAIELSSHKEGLKDGEITLTEKNESHRPKDEAEENKKEAEVLDLPNTGGGQDISEQQVIEGSVEETSNHFQENEMEIQNLRDDPHEETKGENHVSDHPPEFIQNTGLEEGYSMTENKSSTEYIRKSEHSQPDKIENLTFTKLSEDKRQHQTDDVEAGDDKVEAINETVIEVSTHNTEKDGARVSIAEESMTDQHASSEVIAERTEKGMITSQENENTRSKGEDDDLECTEQPAHTSETNMGPINEAALSNLDLTTKKQCEEDESVEKSCVKDQTRDPTIHVEDEVECKDPESIRSSDKLDHDHNTEDVSTINVAKSRFDAALNTGDNVDDKLENPDSDQVTDGVSNHVATEARETLQEVASTYISEDSSRTNMERHHEEKRDSQPENGQEDQLREQATLIAEETEIKASRENAEKRVEQNILPVEEFEEREKDEEPTSTPDSGETSISTEKVPPLTESINEIKGEDGNMNPQEIAHDLNSTDPLVGETGKPDSNAEVPKTEAREEHQESSKLCSENNEQDEDLSETQSTENLVVKHMDSEAMVTTETITQLAKDTEEPQKVPDSHSEDEIGIKSDEKIISEETTGGEEDINKRLFATESATEDEDPSRRPAAVASARDETTEERSHEESLKDGEVTLIEKNKSYIPKDEAEESKKEADVSTINDAESRFDATLKTGDNVDDKLENPDSDQVTDGVSNHVATEAKETLQEVATTDISEDSRTNMEKHHEEKRDSQPENGQEGQLREQATLIAEETEIAAPREHAEKGVEQNILHEEEFEERVEKDEEPTSAPDSGETSISTEKIAPLPESITEIKGEERMIPQKVVDDLNSTDLLVGQTGQPDSNAEVPKTEAREEHQESSKLCSENNEQDEHVSETQSTENLVVKHMDSEAIVTTETITPIVTTETITQLAKDAEEPQKVPDSRSEDEIGIKSDEKIISEEMTGGEEDINKQLFATESVTEDEQSCQKESLKDGEITLTEKNESHRPKDEAEITKTEAENTGLEGYSTANPLYSNPHECSSAESKSSADSSSLDKPPTENICDSEHQILTKSENERQPQNGVEATEDKIIEEYCQNIEDDGANISALASTEEPNPKVHEEETSIDNKHLDQHLELIKDQRATSEVIPEGTEKEMITSQASENTTSDRDEDADLECDQQATSKFEKSSINNEDIDPAMHVEDEFKEIMSTGSQKEKAGQVQEVDLKNLESIRSSDKSGHENNEEFKLITSMTVDASTETAASSPYVHTDEEYTFEAPSNNEDNNKKKLENLSSSLVADGENTQEKRDLNHENEQEQKVEEQSHLVLENTEIEASRENDENRMEQNIHHPQSFDVKEITFAPDTRETSISTEQSLSVDESISEISNLNTDQPLVGETAQPDSGDIVSKTDTPEEHQESCEFRVEYNKQHEHHAETQSNENLIITQVDPIVSTEAVSESIKNIEEIKKFPLSYAEEKIDIQEDEKIIPEESKEMEEATDKQSHETAKESISEDQDPSRLLTTTLIRDETIEQSTIEESLKDSEPTLTERNDNHEAENDAEENIKAVQASEPSKATSRKDIDGQQIMEDSVEGTMDKFQDNEKETEDASTEIEGEHCDTGPPSEFNQNTELEERLSITAQLESNPHKCSSAEFESSVESSSPEKSPTEKIFESEQSQADKAEAINDISIEEADHEIQHDSAKSSMLASAQKPNLEVLEEVISTDNSYLDQHLKVLTDQHASFEVIPERVEKEMITSLTNENTKSNREEDADLEINKQVTSTYEINLGKISEAPLPNDGLATKSESEKDESVTESLTKDEGIETTKHVEDESNLSLTEMKNRKADMAFVSEGEPKGPESIGSSNKSEHENNKEEDASTTNIAQIPYVRSVEESISDAASKNGDNDEDHRENPSSNAVTDEASPQVSIEAVETACKDKNKDTCGPVQPEEDVPPVDQTVRAEDSAYPEEDMNQVRLTETIEDSRTNPETHDVEKRGSLQENDQEYELGEQAVLIPEKMEEETPRKKAENIIEQNTHSVEKFEEQEKDEPTSAPDSEETVISTEKSPPLAESTTKINSEETIFPQNIASDLNTKDPLAADSGNFDIDETGRETQTEAQEKFEDSSKTCTEIDKQDGQHSEAQSPDNLVIKHAYSEEMVTKNTIIKSIQETEELDRVPESLSQEKLDMKGDEKIIPEEPTKMEETTGVSENEALSKLKSVGEEKIEQYFQEGSLKDGAAMIDKKESCIPENDAEKDKKAVEAFGLPDTNGRQDIDEKQVIEESVEETAKSFLDDEMKIQILREDSRGIEGKSSASSLPSEVIQHGTDETIFCESKETVENPEMLGISSKKEQILFGEYGNPTPKEALIENQDEGPYSMKGDEEKAQLSSQNLESLTNAEGEETSAQLEKFSQKENMEEEPKDMDGGKENKASHQEVSEPSETEVSALKPGEIESTAGTLSSATVGMDTRKEYVEVECDQTKIKEEVEVTESEEQIEATSSTDRKISNSSDVLTIEENDTLVQGPSSRLGVPKNDSSRANDSEAEFLRLENENTAIKEVKPVDIDHLEGSDGAHEVMDVTSETKSNCLGGDIAERQEAETNSESRNMEVKEVVHRGELFSHDIKEKDLITGINHEIELITTDDQLVHANTDSPMVPTYGVPKTVEMNKTTENTPAREDVLFVETVTPSITHTEGASMLASLDNEKEKAYSHEGIQKHNEDQPMPLNLKAENITLQSDTGEDQKSSIEVTETLLQEDELTKKTEDRSAVTIVERDAVELKTATSSSQEEYLSTKSGELQMEKGDFVAKDQSEETLLHSNDIQTENEVEVSSSKLTEQTELTKWIEVDNLTVQNMEIRDLSALKSSDASETITDDSSSTPNVYDEKEAEASFIKKDDSATEDPKIVPVIVEIEETGHREHNRGSVIVSVNEGETTITTDKTTTEEENLNSEKEEILEELNEGNLKMDSCVTETDKTTTVQQETEQSISTISRSQDYPAPLLEEKPTVGNAKIHPTASKSTREEIIDEAAETDLVHSIENTLPEKEPEVVKPEGTSDLESVNITREYSNGDSPQLKNEVNAEKILVGDSKSKTNSTREDSATVQGQDDKDTTLESSLENEPTVELPPERTVEAADTNEKVQLASESPAEDQRDDKIHQAEEKNNGEDTKENVPNEKIQGGIQREVDKQFETKHNMSIPRDTYATMLGDFTENVPAATETAHGRSENSQEHSPEPTSNLKESDTLLSTHYKTVKEATATNSGFIEQGRGMDFVEERESRMSENLTKSNEEDFSFTIIEASEEGLHTECEKETHTSESLPCMPETERNDVITIDRGARTSFDSLDTENIREERSSSEEGSNKKSQQRAEEDKEVEAAEVSESAREIQKQEESCMGEVDIKATVKADAETRDTNEEMVQGLHKLEVQLEKAKSTNITEEILRAEEENVSSSTREIQKLGERSLGGVDTNASVKADAEIREIHEGIEQGMHKPDGKTRAEVQLENAKFTNITVESTRAEEENVSSSTEEHPRAAKHSDEATDLAAKPQKEETSQREEAKAESEEDEGVNENETGSVMVEIPKDEEAKVKHKKSHNILSGVGSKVKHSISKVKKAITGKSSHPKTSSPK